MVDDAVVQHPRLGRRERNAYRSNSERAEDPGRLTTEVEGMGALIEEISASIVRRRSTGWAPAQTCSAPTCSVSDTVATSRRVRSHVMTMTTFAALQDVIERTYGERDRERGVSATVACW